MDFIVVSLILGLIFYSIYTKNNTYLSFVKGVKNSLTLAYSIFPYIFAVFIVLELIKISGLGESFSYIFSGVFSLFGVPKELAELVVIKMLSGSGSIAALQDIFLTYGVDSYIAKVASVIVGSSEAIFYLTPVLFSSVKVHRFRYGLPVIILCYFVSIVSASFLCRFI